MKLTKLAVLLLASSQLVSAKPNLGAKNPSHRHTYREMMQARHKAMMQARHVGGEQPTPLKAKEMHKKMMQARHKAMMQARHEGGEQPTPLKAKEMHQKMMQARHKAMMQARHEGGEQRPALKAKEIAEARQKMMQARHKAMMQARHEAFKKPELKTPVKAPILKNPAKKTGKIYSHATLAAQRRRYNIAKKLNRVHKGPKKTLLNAKKPMRLAIQYSVAQAESNQNHSNVSLPTGCPAECAGELGNGVCNMTCFTEAGCRDGGDCECDDQNDCSAMGSSDEHYSGMKCIDHELFVGGQKHCVPVECVNYEDCEECASDFDSESNTTTEVCWYNQCQDNRCMYQEDLYVPDQCHDSSYNNASGYYDDGFHCPHSYFADQICDPVCLKDGCNDGGDCICSNDGDCVDANFFEVSDCYSYHTPQFVTNDDINAANQNGSINMSIQDYLNYHSVPQKDENCQLQCVNGFCAKVFNEPSDDAQEDGATGAEDGATGAQGAEDVADVADAQEDVADVAGAQEDGADAQEDGATGAVAQEDVADAQEDGATGADAQEDVADVAGAQGAEDGADADGAQGAEDVADVAGAQEDVADADGAQGAEDGADAKEADEPLTPAAVIAAAASAVLAAFGIVNAYDYFTKKEGGNSESAKEESASLLGETGQDKLEF